jgi:uncharacterized membrane protein YphA (DoxX/SURF4 family)
MNEGSTKVALLIGRIIAGLFYVYAGINNLLHLSGATGYAAFKGVPFPTLSVILASVLLILGGMSILTGYKPVLGVVAVILFLLPVTLMMHNFWTLDDPAVRIEEMRSFLSNMGLIGSALIFLAVPRPWLWSLDGAFPNNAFFSEPTSVGQHS